MKKITVVVFLLSLFIPFAFSQNGEHIDGGFFVKKVEYNYFMSRDQYNLSSKKNIEKLLLGGFNAPVEFFTTPPLKELLVFVLLVIH